MDIIAKLAEELQIKKGQAEAAVKLIDEGNTIPFIARYRKEATGALSDEILRNLFDRSLSLSLFNLQFLCKFCNNVHVYNLTFYKKITFSIITEVV